MSFSHLRLSDFDGNLLGNAFLGDRRRAGRQLADETLVVWTQKRKASPSRGGVIEIRWEVRKFQHKYKTEKMTKDDEMT